MRGKLGHKGSQGHFGAILFPTICDSQKLYYSTYMAWLTGGHSYVLRRCMGMGGFLGPLRYM